MDGERWKWQVGPLYLSECVEQGWQNIKDLNC
jgi:hypothetical protein